MSYAAISIGLFIFILAYFTFNAPLQPPIAKVAQQQVEVSQFCQTPSESDAPTFQAPADDALKPEPTRGKCDGIRHSLRRGKVTYRLIRRNVPLTTTDVKEHGYNWDDSSCHFDTADKLGVDIPEIDKTKFKVFYPEISGEISLNHSLYSRTRGGDRDLMYFIDYGLVFLLHINQDGTLTELKGGTTQGQSETFVLADIYQDQDSDRPALPDEALACDTTKGAAIVRGPQVLQPAQQVSTDSAQLQLQYFVFGTARGSSQVVNGWGIHCKPAVYLYPEKKQLVNVQVHPKGQLSYTDPVYDPVKGWTVEAFPDGKLNYEAGIMNHGKTEYDYLYYESKLYDSEIQKPTTGWVVKPDEIEQLFNRVLPQLGLNKKEQKDFMDYWLTKLPDSPYYFVGLVDKTQRDYLEALSVTPQPQTSIRFSLYFEALDQPKAVSEPEIITPKRNGFTLVDWGGMVKLHPGTPFTCSQ